MSKHSTFEEWAYDRPYWVSPGRARVRVTSRGYEIKTFRYSPLVGKLASYCTELYVHPDDLYRGWRKEMAYWLREHRRQLAALVSTGSTVP